MLRQVRGPGTLVPREIRWIAAQSAGRVERVFVRPGAVVEPDTVLAVLSNPDLMRQAEEARLRARDLRRPSSRSSSSTCAAKSSIRRRPSRRRAPLTKARGCRPKPSARPASLPSCTVRRSELSAEALKATYDIQVERLNQFGATVEAQICRAARAARSGCRTPTIACASRSRRCKSAPVSPASCRW